MKLNIDVSPIQTNINREEIKYFTIKNNTKMFNILSDGLYSDKISAIIRELSCNAWDAHVAAGTQETPFEIYLPTYLDPEFKIKDYGIGLSPEQVRDVFTVYGESDKTHSNDFTGALGLGSKSPFSYVESYTVISRHNGKQYIYTALKDEIGQPAILHVSTEDTSEQNGIEISFPVLNGDFIHFKNKVAQILSHFPVKPKVVGDSNFSVIKKDVILDGDGWKLLKANHLAECSPSAIMANVKYPINISALKDTSVIYSTLSKLPIEFHFNNGDLDFAASREQLSYTPQTIEKIKSRIKQMLVNLSNIVSIEFNSCKTLWEAKVKWSEGFSYSSKYYTLSSLIEHAGIPVKWKNELIKDSTVLIKANAFDRFGDVFVGIDKKRVIRVNNFPDNDKTLFKKATGSGIITTASYCDPTISSSNVDRCIAIKSHIRIFVAEKKPGLQAAFHKMRKDNIFASYCMVVFINKDQDIKSVTKKISKLCYGAPVKDITKELSDYKKEENKKSKPVQTLYAFTLTKYFRYDSDYRKYDWDKVILDTSNEIGYVELSQFRPIMQFDSNNFKKLVRLLSKISSSTWKPPVLVGIRSNTLKRIKNKSKLKPYREVIKDSIISFAKSHAINLENVANSSYISDKYSNNILEINNSVNILLNKLTSSDVIDLNNDSTLKILYTHKQLLESLKISSENEKLIKEICSFLDIKFHDIVKPNPKVISDVNDLIIAINSVNSKYSMLKYLNEYLINTDTAKVDILKYVKFIDDIGDK